MVKYALVVHGPSLCLQRRQEPCHEHLFATPLPAEKARGVHRLNWDQREGQARWVFTMASIGWVISKLVPIRICPLELISVRMNIGLVFLRRNTN